MQNPDILKDSDIQITKSSDHYLISIPGYKFGFTLIGMITCGFSCTVLSALLYRASSTREIILYSLVLAGILLILIMMHSRTLIYFSKKEIKVGYSWSPYFWKRNTQSLNKIYIDDGGDNYEGSSFIYLTLSFTSWWSIKIIVDHLSRTEREFITSRLSYLRYNFSAN